MSRWIPCSERLPNDKEIKYDGIGREGKRVVSDRVLAVDKNGFMRTGYFISSCKPPLYADFGEHYLNDTTQWIVGSGSAYEPIAWMRLPKPYKESE